MTAKVPLRLTDASLGQLQAYGQIIDIVQNKGTFDAMQLRANISMIAFNTPVFKDIIPINDLKLIGKTILESCPAIVNDYNRHISEPLGRSFFMMPMYDVEGNSRGKMRLTINTELGDLPSLIWGQLMNITKGITKNDSFETEFARISPILARIAWGKNEQMIVPDRFGENEVNMKAIQFKEDNIYTMNASDAVQGYVFFLIMWGSYLVNQGTKSLNRKSIMRILKQARREKTFRNGGVGLDLLRILSQEAMKQYSEEN